MWACQLRWGLSSQSEAWVHRYTTWKMEWLPDEVLLKILSYLTQQELCTCMRVCQRWNRLCNDGSLWEEIVLGFEQISLSPSILKQISRQHHQLNSLVIASDRLQEPDLSEAGVEAFVSRKTWSQLGPLSQITLLSCPKEYLYCIPNIIDACCKTLECFRCEDTRGLKGDHFQSLFWTSLMHYKELSLAHCPNIDNLAVFEARHHPNFRECLKSLLVLNLDGTGVDDLTDDGVMEILRACPLLQSLALDGEALTDITPNFIGTNLPHLRKLTFSFCSHLTDSSLQSLAKLRQLQTLQLKKCEHFTSKGFQHLFNSFNQIPSVSPLLRELSIIHCTGLDDMALLKLAETFPDLFSLDISWCWDITDHGLDAVALHCRGLTSLTLGGLVHCTCGSILDAPMARLRYLGLVQSDSVDDDKLIELKRVKPWMTIKDYYDTEVGGED